MKTIVLCFLAALLPGMDGLFAQFILKCEGGQVMLETPDDSEWTATPTITIDPTCASSGPYTLAANGAALSAPDHRLADSWPVRLEVRRGGRGIAAFTITKSLSPPILYDVENRTGVKLLPGKNTLRDALEMARHWQNQEYDYVAAYLKKYGLSATDRASIVFLNDYLATLPADVDLAPGATSDAKWADSHAGSGATMASLSGILDPTLGIDAIAKFAVRRFKEELVVAYLDDFKKQLQENADMQLLMPGVHHTLLGEDYFNYTRFLTSLRQNAEGDLRAMPYNLQQFCRARFAAESFYAPVMSGLELVQSAQQRMPAALALESLAERDYIRALSTAFTKTTRTVGLLSRHLHAWRDESATGWAPTPAFVQLAEDKDALNFWLALWLFQEKANLTNINTTAGNLYDILNAAGVVETHGRIRQLLALVARAQNAAQGLSQIDEMVNDTAKFQRFADYLLSLVEIVDEAHRLLPALGGVPADVPKVATLLRSTRDIYVAAHTRQYGIVLARALQLLRELDTQRTIPWLGTLNRQGDFLVTLCTATTSDELVEALEATALPVQSYRIKRHTKFNVALNLYPGGFGGYEWNYVDSLGTVSEGFSPAFTTPLGLAISWGSRGGGSFTIFAPVIDVGAVAAFRFDDEASTLPELEWKNVFAPGLYLVAGLRRSPIAIGAGWQAGPALRRIDREAMSTVEARGNRIGAFLTVDIPVFNLFSGKLRYGG
jgi:hypothetical protein